MAMNITGKVHFIGETQQVTEKFSKRDLVIEYVENPQYPEFIKFEATQEKTNLFDPLAIGDTVQVEFNLRGRAWTNREGQTSYFNTLNAWRVAKVDPNQQGGYGQPVQPAYNPNQQGGYNQNQGNFNQGQQGGYNQNQGNFNQGQQGGYNQNQDNYNQGQQGAGQSQGNNDFSSTGEDDDLPF